MKGIDLLYDVNGRKYLNYIKGLHLLQIYALLIDCIHRKKCKTLPTHLHSLPQFGRDDNLRVFPKKRDLTRY